MGVFLVILACIALGVLVTYLRRQANRALNRQLFDRGGHAQGRELTRETITFTAPGSAADVIDKVSKTLALPTELPGAFVARLVELQHDEGFIVFGYGNRVSMSFRAALLVENLPGGGAKASYTVLKWTERSGIVAGIPTMALLANTIRACAAEQGGSLGPVVLRPETSAQAGSAATVEVESAAPLPVEPVSAAAAAREPEPEPHCNSCGSTFLGARFCTDCGAALAA